MFDRRSHSLSWLAVLLVGCSSGTSEPTPDPLGPDASTGGSVDAANPGGGTAKVSGTIKRSAAPMGDAVGDVYVALFDRDPVTQMMQAQLVARARIVGANLAAATATVPYELVDVPPRAETYYLVAFLDDNANVDMAHPEKAGPDRGDLVSLDGLAAPKLGVTTAGTQSHDITLNSVLPF